ncbi:MAG TPA: hypothetical protein VLT62_25940 [Candidatus Methylomirabilis sp.]|nr:hypothetical protein [Candidatus Methylomirabilis sp.]
MENPARQMKWTPWKMATVGIAVAITTALVTGLVVTNLAGNASNVMATSGPAAAVPGGATRNETGVRSNRAVSKRNATTDVLEKAVIGGASSGGAGKGAAIGGTAGAAAGTLSGLHDR